MHAVKLTALGDSLAVVLPQEVVDRLHLVKGDTVYLSNTAEGLRVTMEDIEREEQLKLGGEFMSEFHETFHELAQ